MPGQSPMAEGSFGPITDDGRWTNPAPIAGSATNVVTQETQLTAASKKKNILHSAVEQWKSASLPQKIIAGLLPFAFVAVFIVFDNDEPEAKSTPKSASSTVASVQKMDAGSAAASAPPTQDKPSDEPPVGTAATEDAGEPPLPKGQKTLQRKAADALAAGNDEGALVLYEELLHNQPNNTAYRDIVRILRARKNK